MPAEDPEEPQLVAALRALVSDSGRDVKVLLAGKLCSHATVSATENVDRVVLHGYASAKDTQCAPTQSVETPSARLSAPLGERALVDKSTSSAVPYFDGSNLFAVNYLPAGYEWARDDFMTPSGVSPTSVDAPLSWTRIFTGSPRAPDVALIQAKATDRELVAWPIVGTAEVAGAKAELRQTRQSSAITWRMHGFDVAVTAQVNNERTTDPMDFTTLATIAAELKKTR